MLINDAIKLIQRVKTALQTHPNEGLALKFGRQINKMEEELEILQSGASSNAARTAALGVLEIEYAELLTEATAEGLIS